MRETTRPFRFACATALVVGVTAIAACVGSEPRVGGSADAGTGPFADGSSPTGDGASPTPPADTGAPLPGDDGGTDAGVDGASSLCAPGALRCNGSAPQACDGGAWVNQPACGGSSPVCSNGVCGTYRVNGGVRSAAPPVVADAGIRVTSGGFELGARTCNSAGVCVTGGDRSMKGRARIVVGITAFGLAVGLGYALRASASGIPATNALAYAGTLEDATGRVTGTHNIQVIFYDAATAGTNICQSPTAPLAVIDGYFSVPLPDVCRTAVAANANAWVDVLVDGSDTGRTKIGAVPFAVEANHATSADNATHATNADNASAAAGALATTLSGLQTTVSGLQTNDPSFAGAGGTVRGGAPPASGFTFQAGSTVAVSDANDLITVTFPHPFPSGVASIVLSNGDNCCGSAMWVDEASVTTSSFQAKTSNAGLNQRVNWIAVGW